MKKQLLLLSSLVLLLGGISARETLSPVMAEDEASEESTITYLPFSQDNFSFYEGGNADDKGTLDADFNFANYKARQWDTFWPNGRHFGALDDFYYGVGWGQQGEKGEAWTGWIVSASWVQKAGSPYVTFTLGGNVQDPSFVRIVDDGGNNATTLEGDGKITNGYFRDPVLSNNMAVRVVEIAEEYLDKEIHLEIYDGKTGDFGMVNFGALSPNQTADDVVDTIWKQGFGGQGDAATNNLDKSNDDVAAQKYLWDIYNNSANAEYEVFQESLEQSLARPSIAEDFESGALSAEWTLDYNFVANAGAGEGGEEIPVAFPGGADLLDPSLFVSDRETISWKERLPFNKDGRYFLNGWRGEGGAAAESLRWRLLSRPFTLSGSGLIAAKMGGHNARLALYAYDGSKPAPDAEPLVSADTLGWWKDGMQTWLGGRNVTMRRTYLDASAYLGKTVVLALEDCRVGGDWGHAFFDSLDTNVSLDGFAFKVDVVSQAYASSPEGASDDYALPHYAAIPDCYVGPETTAEGLQPLADAGRFLDAYYAAARSPEAQYTYCESLYDEEIAALAASYRELSPEARDIVDRSEDYSYAGYLSHPETTDYTSGIFKDTVGNAMNTITAANPGDSAYYRMPSEKNVDLLSVLGSVLILLVVAGLGAYIVIRRKRQKQSW